MWKAKEALDSGSFLSVYTATGGSNEYPQSIFLSRNKKINVYPCKTQFYCKKKVGFKGSKLYMYVFVMENSDRT